VLAQVQFDRQSTEAALSRIVWHRACNVFALIDVLETMALRLQHPVRCRAFDCARVQCGWWVHHIVRPFIIVQTEEDAQHKLRLLIVDSPTLLIASVLGGGKTHHGM
jgi:hypothetical protein